MAHPATKGFSLRRHLESLGVTTEEAMRAHLAHVYHLIQVLPTLRAVRYRINMDNPNAVSYSFCNR